MELNSTENTTYISPSVSLTTTIPNSLISTSIVYNNTTAKVETNTSLNESSITDNFNTTLNSYPKKFDSSDYNSTEQYN